MQMNARVITREHLAIIDLFFMVPSSNDMTISSPWALRRANAADLKSYAACKLYRPKKPMVLGPFTFRESIFEPFLSQWHVYAQTAELDRIDR